MWRRLISLVVVVLVLSLGGKASAELVARYSFDDATASDSAYYIEDAEGTFYGDAKVVDDPCRGLVLELDGIGDYVRVENNDVAEFSTESFSYSFWSKTTLAGVWFYFWKGVDYEGDDTPMSRDHLHGVNCYHDDTIWVRFSLYNYSEPGGGEKSRTEVPETNCVNGTWVHIACVRDVSKPGEELRFYVNGVLEPTTSTEDPNPNEDECGDINNPGHLYIGCNDRGYPPDINSNPTAFFFGRMDDFRAYNHALSEQELYWLANNMTDPNLASDPNPQDGAYAVCPGVSLSWTGGDNVVDHNVYFGTSLSDVNSSATVYIAHHPSTSFSPTLEYGTTYYWRIEEVNPGHPDSPWGGSIWKFTTNDGNAFDPYPADGQTQVPLDPTLTWSPGCLAVSHELYFGTNYDEVGAAEENSEPNVYYEDRGDVNSYDACTPEYSTYHYWRVDEVNGPTTWRGEVLTFKSRSSIVDPNLRVWYELDETQDEVAVDSSGREYDGELEGDGVWDANGYYGGCFSLDDNGHIVVPMGVLAEIDKEITISVWLNTGTDEDSENVVCSAGADWEPNYMRVAVPDDDHDVSWRAGNETNDVMEWDGGSPKAWKGSWNHFAFVKDENAGKMQIYLNGLRVAEQTGASPGTLAALRIRNFRIGTETDDASSYIGKIDDYQLYDRALTAKEIEEIFRGGDLASAWGQSPYDGEDEVPYDVVLRWRPGDYAADPNAHEVYFGTSWDDVNDANNLLPVGTSVYKGPQDLDSNSYDPPGLLVLGQTYYWRIDEVNDANNDRWKGKIWSFTVADYITIDDFEDDTAQDPPINDWYKIGSAGITLRSTPPVIGEHSMRYSYDNWWDFGPGYYSEIESINLEPNDWTLFDQKLKLLSLWFYGQSGNAATITEQMYVYLEDNDACEAQVKYGDA
ncbi:MAG: LamG-like jellyroll fold domain-containing protein, partial [Planctomycetota bacterium]